jgi:hypothetical protein
MMGNYQDDEKIGKHVVLTCDGDVEVEEYWIQS